MEAQGSKAQEVESSVTAERRQFQTNGNLSLTYVYSVGWALHFVENGGCLLRESRVSEK